MAGLALAAAPCLPFQMQRLQPAGASHCAHLFSNTQPTFLVCRFDKAPQQYTQAYAEGHSTGLCMVPLLLPSALLQDHRTDVSRLCRVLLAASCRPYGRCSVTSIADISILRTHHVLGTWLVPGVVVSSRQTLYLRTTTSPHAGLTAVPANHDRMNMRPACACLSAAVSLSACVSVRPSVCQAARPFVLLSVCLSLCPYVCLSSVCLSVL